MEVDPFIVRVFKAMLEAGLCSASDWPNAEALCHDWLTLYNETLSQQGDKYYHDDYPYRCITEKGRICTAL